MRLYLVRHGETRLNREYRFIGRTDPALSEKGKAQAREIAERLASEGIEAIYTSDLLRTRQTAGIIAGRLGLNVVITPELREIDFGDWEGLSYDEIVMRDKEHLEAWMADPTHIDIPGGESWRHFELRINSALEEIIKAEDDGNILIITHGGPIKLLMTRFHEGDPHFFNSFWPQAGGLNIVEVDDQSVTVLELSGIKYAGEDDTEGE